MQLNPTAAGLFAGAIAACRLYATAARVSRRPAVLKSVKLAILKCPGEYDYGKMLKDYFLTIANTVPAVELSVKIIDATDIPETNEELQRSDCDAYLITGSVAGAYETDPWIGNLAQHIKSLHARRKKLMGICFGHQLICQALGGHVEKNEKGWGLGVRQFELRPEAHDYLQRLLATYSSYKQEGDRASFPEVPRELQLLYVHQDHVTWDKFPSSLKLLGGNCHAPVLGAYDDSHSVLTVQGHPEFSFGIVRHIMENLTEAGQLPQRLAAGESLETVESKLAGSAESSARDSEIIGRCLLGFLLQ